MFKMLLLDGYLGRSILGRLKKIGRIGRLHRIGRLRILRRIGRLIKPSILRNKENSGN